MSDVFHLEVVGGVLTLVETATGVPCLSIDFLSPALQHRRKHGADKHSPFAKAIGLREKSPLYVLDVTAGLCRDAFVLAYLGNRVTCLERNPTMVALVQDALRRGDEDASLQDVLSRITYIQSQALEYLQGISAGIYEKPDIIYIDPMFPDTRKTRQVKKEMQVLHTLIGKDEDSAMLLAFAQATCRYRVVVKRPLYAPPLADAPPGFSLAGSSNRYDVYTICSLRNKTVQYS